MWPGAQALRGTTGINVEYRVRRKDLDISWLGSHNFGPIRDKDGNIAGGVIVARDITEKKRADNALRASEERYRTAFQTSLDGISITRLRDGRYIDVNQTFCEITGYRREEIFGHTSLELGFWVKLTDRSELIDRLRAGEQYRDVQIQLRRKNGEIFWSQASATLFELDGETCVMYVMRDISAAKAAEEEIRNLSFFDPLTGLANRRSLTEQLQRVAQTAEGELPERAMLFVDLDDFKSLNDALGHQAGDLLLREVAHRLENCVRKGDTVARMGGDEFVVLLEALDANPKDAAPQAQAVAEKILAELARPYLIGEREINSACSIGIALFSGGVNEISEIVRQAEIAMYQAKASGRGGMRFFAPELQVAVSARAALEDDLREGIRAKQFVLYYQPQVEGGRILGAEALVRWKHPSRGVLAPGEFIALAEETKLILPLGAQVLETACAQIATWAGSRQTSGINLSVNISALQLGKEDFVDSVLAVLDRTGANPRNLKLELTESMLVNDIEVVIDKMARLKSYGLSFSVDDFGTGYSSLAYLKRLPLDQLKIDRAFVRDILVDQSSRAIARTIVNLCQAMGISVMAEGVETQEQLDLLISMGCHAYQGYLFSRPVPIEEFEALLKREPTNA
jgi:diguanylate cyclase (GGDEF)-like protein/PAS domain S-box-containing protein